LEILPEKKGSYSCCAEVLMLLRELENFGSLGPSYSTRHLVTGIQQVSQQASIVKIYP